MLKQDIDNALTERIIGAFYDVYNALGSGFLEKIYERALLIELEQRGLKVEAQKPIKVNYKGNLVGECFTDSGKNLVLNGYTDLTDATDGHGYYGIYKC